MANFNPKRIELQDDNVTMPMFKDMVAKKVYGVHCSRASSNSYAPSGINLYA